MTTTVARATYGILIKIDSRLPRRGAEYLARGSEKIIALGRTIQVRSYVLSVSVNYIRSVCVLSWKRCHE